MPASVCMLIRYHAIEAIVGAAAVRDCLTPVELAGGARSAPAASPPLPGLFHVQLVGGFNLDSHRADYHRDGSIKRRNE